MVLETGMPIEINGAEYLLATEIAGAVGVSRQTLWRWRRDGKIPMGQKYRGCQIVFTYDELETICQFSKRLEPVDGVMERQGTLFGNRH